MVRVGMLTVVGLLLALGAFAQPIEWEPVTLDNYLSLMHEHAIADLDGDGDLDIASAYWDSTLWYENLGGATEWARHPIDIGKPTEGGLEAADFDGDGDVDIAISATHQFGSTAWFENDGSGQFTRHTLATDQSGYAAVAIDLDDDGDLDFVQKVGMETPELRGWIDGPDGMTMVVLYEYEQPSTGGLFVVDWDHDGDLDILDCWTWSYPDMVNVFINDGGTWTLQHILRNVHVHEISAVDLDQDGDWELVGSDTQNHGVAFQQEGHSWLKVPLAGDTSWPNHTVGDMDSDGDLDIVATSIDDLFFYERQDDNTFVQHAFSQAGVFSADVTAIDMDGDGDDDLVVNYAHPGTLQIFLQPGTPDPLNITLLPAGDPPYELAAGESLQFTVRLNHDLPAPMDVLLWSEAVTPGGDVVGPFASVPVSLDEWGYRLFPNLQQTVPAATQPGTYLFRVSVGENLQTPLASDQVEVTVIEP